MARLIDGKEIAESIYENINLRARELRGRGVIPKLAVVLVGDNPASRLYVNSKEKRARENGIETEEHHLDGSVAEAQVTELIKKLNWYNSRCQSIWTSCVCCHASLPVRM